MDLIHHQEVVLSVIQEHITIKMQHQHVHNVHLVSTHHVGQQVVMIVEWDTLAQFLLLEFAMLALKGVYLFFIVLIGS